MSYYVTTPIYYVNDTPHIGHIYTTLVADTLARYQRLVGEDVFFLTGTDEHGQKIERAAAEQGLEPTALADRVVEKYRALWEKLDITNDDFVRTTEERHRRGVEALIERIANADDLYVDHHEGWYCVSCETYYTEKELGPDRQCPTHERPAEWRTEENVFFRLSAYQDDLLAWYGEEPAPVRPESRLNEVRSFVESGLRDLSVSRASLSWGIPFPGHEGQTVYVWLDALTNYISALGFGSDDRRRFDRFWNDPFGQRIHLVGKDILRFHAVYWPAFLMSAGLPLPTAVWAHGWWLKDERKVSKSVGAVVRPTKLIDDLGADTLRYFLLRDMVFGQDAQFSDEACLERFNSDLANGLGNTVSRLVTLTRKAFEGMTPPEPCFDNPIMQVAEEVVDEYREAMAELAFQRALRALWRLHAEASQYLVAKEPWKLLDDREQRPEVSRVLWTCLEAVRIIAVGLTPFLPEAAPRVLAAIGVEKPPQSFEALEWGGLPNSRAVGEPPVLFPRVDKEEFFSEAELASTPSAGDGDSPAPVSPPEETQEEEMIDIQEFARIDLRVGTVTAAEPVPKSNKLLQLRVDLGDEERTLVAGISKQYAPEDVVGRQVVVVANLKPATIMGVESQGMVLAASVDGAPVLLAPREDVPNGTEVR